MRALPRTRWPWLVPGALVLSWLGMVARMWIAFWTLPSPELLQRRRAVQPPTFASLRWEALQAVAELATLCLVLWPTWRRYYRLRMIAAGLAVLVWFLFTTPLAISSVQRVHRIWLLATGVLLVLIAIAGLFTSIGSRLLRGSRPGAE